MMNPPYVEPGIDMHYSKIIDGDFECVMHCPHCHERIVRSHYQPGVARAQVSRAYEEHLKHCLEHGTHAKSDRDAVQGL